jgi:hypothetical protein
LRLELDLRDSQKQLEEAKTALAGIVDQLIAVERARQTFIGGMDEQSAGLLQLAEKAKAGQITLEQFVSEFTQFADAPRPSGDPFKDISRQTLDAAQRVQDLTGQVDKLREAQSRISRGRIVSKEEFGPFKQAPAERKAETDAAKGIETLTTKIRDLEERNQLRATGRPG